MPSPDTGYNPMSLNAVAALATVGAGVVLERSGDAIAGHIGLSGVLFGATLG